MLCKKPCASLEATRESIRLVYNGVCLKEGGVAIALCVNESVKADTKVVRILYEQSLQCSSASFSTRQVTVISINVDR